MTAPVLVLLALAAGPCEDVFDRTARCPAPDEVLLEDAAAPLPPAPAPDPDATVGGELAPRYFVAAGTTALLGVGATVASLWYGLHIDNLAQAGRLPADTEETLRLQQGVATISAAGLYFGTLLLAGAGGVFLVFDPARGGLVEGFPPIEE